MSIDIGLSKAALFSVFAHALRSRIACCAMLALLPDIAQSASVVASDRDLDRQPIDNAVVYAVPASGIVRARSSRRASIEQVNKQFVPYVTVVQTGTKISFPNKDSLQHDVYSFSPAKRFNLKLYSGLPETPQVFDKPGAVVLGCNIHDWMLAYVYVVETPHFAKTAKGSAQISGLAPGSYIVKAWHPQMRGPEQSERISVDNHGAASVQFSMELLPKGQIDTTPPAQ